MAVQLTSYTRETPVGALSPQRFLESLLQPAAPDRDRRVALAGKSGKEWEETTYATLDDRSRRLARLLIELGVHAGDHVAVVGESSPDWVVAFLAVLRAGAVAVPLDAKLTSHELRPILEDARPVAVLCSRSVHDSVGRLFEEVPSVHAVLPWPYPPSQSRAAGEVTSPRVMSDTALIVYTSGTTGRSKGVTLSYANLAHQVRCATRLQRLTGRERFLSILPLSHTFELSCGLLSPLATGGQVNYSGSLLPDEIAAAMAERQVTGMVVVPLFLKLLKTGIERKLARAPRASRLVLQSAGVLADAVPRPSVRRVAYAPLLRKFGGRLRVFYVGGAPLDLDVAEYFVRMGISVYQGYGLTETSPIVAMNAPAANRLGSVGRPLPDVEVRIDTDVVAPAGEGAVLVRGPNVMLGYHCDAEATRATIDADGWLDTGDLGHSDADGFLWITGRSKNVIVLANGKNVQPEEVEHVLEQSTLVREVCVLGRAATGGLADGSEEVHAVVVPTDDAKASRTGEELQALMEAEVRNLTQRLATYKHPRTITVWTHELPKTATRKVKRTEVGALLAKATSHRAATSRQGNP